MKSLGYDEVAKICLTHSFNNHTIDEYIGKYDVTDEDILSAITWHTTGKPEMTLLEKIVYIADYIEPRRYKADNLPQMRKLAYEDLDKTMYEILKSTLEYLAKRGAAADPMTATAYEYFRQLVAAEK